MKTWLFLYYSVPTMFTYDYSCVFAVFWDELFVLLIGRGFCLFYSCALNHVMYFVLEFEHNDNRYNVGYLF